MSSFLGSPQAQRIFIPHTSWKSTFVWWITKLIKPLNAIRRFFYPIPVPPKGPQLWAYPPAFKALNRLMHKGEESVVGQWRHEPSGWVMTSVSPPSSGEAKKETTRTILYFHGSAFQVAPLHWHFGYASYLARELNAEVALVPYPLAPTNTVQEVMPVITIVYQQFLERAAGRETIVAGDSAGGMLSLCLAAAAHDAGLPLPSQILAISPAINFAMDNPDMARIVPYDNSLGIEFCRKASLLWAGVDISGKPHKNSFFSVPIPDEILKNPHFNPAAVDLDIFVKAGTKIVLVSGEWDLLHADIVPFAEKAEKAGVQITFIEGEHQFHCFAIAVGVSPECTRAAELITKQIIANGAGVGH